MRVYCTKVSIDHLDIDRGWVPIPKYHRHPALIGAFSVINAKLRGKDRESTSPNICS